MRAELLAPAGSYDSMVAAFAAGADAVYIGGSRFGARAFADNLDEKRMLQAIDYAHLKDKKLYLTVNTLVKDQEMEDLYSYLRPYYLNGLDAVIVQDLGVMQFVKREFPGMDIHASTQMTVTGEYGAAFLKELGASRVVTARELSFEEIKDIYDKTGVEIESFIHGALCFCYSGQCLFSSLIGGRSGNRGRCAQPCRLAYQLMDGNDVINREKDKYLLSPKDMCTLQILPQILESGVYSLKIEGRMKRLEYTAGVVRVYRKYLDMLQANGKKNYRVQKSDMEELMDLYNRGGFTDGYYKQHNGPDMMSMERPNHWGTEAAKVISAAKGSCRIKALEDLHNKDVLEYRFKDKEVDITLNQPVKRGQEVSVTIPKNLNISGKNAIFYRTRNEDLLSMLEKEYLQKKYSENIYGKLILSMDKSAILTLEFQGVTVQVTGDSPQAAQNRPITKADVEKQMRKTGGTHFQFDILDIEMEDKLFLPMQSLNELRRHGIQELEKAIKEKYARTEQDRPVYAKKNIKSDTKKLSLTVSVERKEQLQAALGFGQIERIYLDNAFFKNREDFIRQASDFVKRCKEAGKECWYVMPWIFRNKAKKYYCGQEIMRILELFDGILLKSMEEYQFLMEQRYHGKMAGDYNLYTWNHWNRELWSEMGLLWDTVPLELNCHELKERGCHGSEMVVYGYLPVMVSAQCQIKNHLGCIGKEQMLYIKDRKQKKFPVTNRCSFCYNIIYNSTPLELAENSNEIVSMRPESVRLQFTIENGKETEQIIHDYAKIFVEDGICGRDMNEFTRGHFKRGVE